MHSELHEQPCLSCLLCAVLLTLALHISVPPPSFRGRLAVRAPQQAKLWDYVSRIHTPVLSPASWRTCRNHFISSYWHSSLNRSLLLSCHDPSVTPGRLKSEKMIQTPPCGVHVCVGFRSSSKKLEKEVGREAVWVIYLAQFLAHSKSSIKGS